MALLDSMFGQTPSYFGGLLGEDELSRLRQQAQEQGTLNTAMALLQAGAPSRTPGGGALAIAQGLQQGQQAYRQALNQGLQEKLVGLQLGEQMRKLNESQRMREMFPQIFQVTQTPEQLTMYGKPTEGVIRDDEGNLMPGGGVTPAQRTINVDTNKLLALTSMSSNPLETLTAMSKLVPDLRKAGFTGGMQGMENPFSVYANDPSVPPALRQVAANYQQSYARGLIDQETADKRLADLGARVQSAQQFQQSQADIAANRQFMQNVAAQNAATQSEVVNLRKQQEANKPETFSYSQKKEFDDIVDARQEAKKAEANASIAQRAAPLLSQAYGSQAEAIIKGVSSAVIPGFTADAKTANDELERYSQTLAVNAPRFSGPTSDADAKRYDKAVGDLGNPKITLDAKKKALQEIQYLGQKSRAYANQAENYFYQNNKSMRGFQFVPPPDPFAAQNAPF